ncbi:MULTISPECIES: TRAP transporter substrate-binding protein [unclassified Oceanobacter]|jgi:TRAP-type mannitol/chloroaromatic compound transport system substrate-binding protein|uniref:TRAP transporter substrate-binding protein n=1 Tax=unclassified Oceanobacter TaxID=2620260 RepID=UPI0026E2AE5E|nr:MULTISPECIES: TRAP transporter substrate-binding protein [unclassified Oceanobacter]MDO6682649.1 TRAP transporter substrate-binding protein [Oceanobacter sp. 5_MG-2023]MDP2505848.1 TRAP transporter substrate-binding protein [Oceanobacter sp. 3_MG-2023]MDP2548412.1 TRAP transporter substrate-binding protein [Oceanobacter sp. 4_MG-2023]MDP2610539.1 TRAP transporter substrate-binding protein [Oceanobacter sp. 1_MG-2023]MDP2613796.1 TRAP transporter substrate-binding protein [Oceanobacter sp. 2
MKRTLSTLVATSALALCCTAVQAKPILLKTPIAFGSNLPALGTPIAWVADQLPLVSGGEVKMKLYEPGKLVAPLQILDAVSAGKVNSGYSIAGYWAGKMPAAAIFSTIPFGPEAPEFAAWMYYGNGLKLYQKMYDDAGYNVHVEPCSLISPETSGWFKKPVNSLEDLKGLNMRFYGLGGEVLAKLGVSTSLIPGGEIFGALEKGAIDATEFSQPAIDQKLGFYKVAKHNYFPGWHQQATFFELLINGDTWKSMSDQQRAVVSTTCKASVTNSVAESEFIQFEAIRANMEERGVTVHEWPKEMLDAFKGAWDEVAAEQRKDPTFAAVYDDLQTFRTNYQLWSSRAFLPRD